MDPVYQLILDVLIGMCGFLMSSLLFVIWGRMGKLEIADSNLAGEVKALHILVAGQYVTRTEVEPKLDAIYTELKEMRKDISRRRGQQGTD